MNRVNENIRQWKKVKVIWGHIKVKCEICQAQVMIILYVKFNVHFTHANRVIVIKVADRRTDGRTRLMTTIGIRQNFG